MKKYLSIDIGGTLIKYGVLLEIGELLYKKDRPTPSDLEAMKLALESIYREIADNEELEGIAISCPGKVDSREGIVYYGGALTYLHQFPIADFMKNLSGKSVVAINDGKAAALAEKWQGNLADVENGMALVLGTGLGGGIILNNQLLQGHHFQAGEFSFLLPNDEHPDGEHGAGFRYSPVQMIGKIADVLGLPDKKDGRQVFEYINAGNEEALAIFKQFCKYLAILIYNTQAIIDTQRVVIGGGISAQPILLQEIEKQYRDLLAGLPFVGAMITPVEILPCKFGGDANLMGSLYQLLQEN
ncbi:ROK family protein [Streptococcus suis]|nr:ROK family protein [Streptococcus suis]